MMLQHISPHFVGQQSSSKQPESLTLKRPNSPINYRENNQSPVNDDDNDHFLQPAMIIKRRISDDDDEDDDKRQISVDDDEWQDDRNRFFIKSEIDDDLPLDLSIHSDNRRNRNDSGTDSDDSGGPGEDQGQGRAYKKSLMKRYCKYDFPNDFIIT